MPLQALIVLFIALPVLELALLFKLHGLVGFVPTVGLVLLTGVAGAMLVRRQGISILFAIQREMAEGRLPAPQMIDGVMILLAGALLVTPGLVTDSVGFALLIPRLRTRIRLWLKRRIEQKIRSGQWQVHVGRGRS